MIILNLIVFLGLALTIYATVLAQKRLVGRNRKPGRQRPITVLKPCKGIDYSLWYNLESLAGLDWMLGYDKGKRDELIFCLDSFTDPAHKYVDRFIFMFPHVPAKKYVAQSKTNLNPKVSNILAAYMNANNDLILISDSNVQLPSNYLNILDNEFKDGCGVLTSTLCCTKMNGLAAEIEAMLIHRFYNKWLLVLNSINESIVLGKSMMFRKSALETCGGLLLVGSFMAEDYNIGKFISATGLRTKVMSIPVQQPIGWTSFREVFNRNVRWSRMRKAHAPWIFMLEPLTYFTVCSMLCMFIMPWWSAVIIQTLWTYIEIRMIRKVGGRMSFLAYVVSEWLMLPIWFVSLLGNTVKWRGSIYRVNREGKCTKELMP